MLLNCKLTFLQSSGHWFWVFATRPQFAPRSSLHSRLNCKRQNRYPKSCPFCVLRSKCTMKAIIVIAGIASFARGAASNATTTRYTIERSNIHTATSNHWKCSTYASPFSFVVNGQCAEHLQTESRVIDLFEDRALFAVLLLIRERWSSSKTNMTLCCGPHALRILCFVPYKKNS